VTYDSSQHADTGLAHRFDSNTRGIEAWRSLVDKIENFAGADPESSDGALTSFFQDVHGLGPPARQPACLFISHKQEDREIAERIAFLTTGYKFDYWLDVHDPTLARVPSNDPRYAVLVAAIIEIALLNSNHIIALHTAQSKDSKWIPYEHRDIDDTRVQDFIGSNAFKTYLFHDGFDEGAIRIIEIQCPAGRKVGLLPEAHHNKTPLLACLIRVRLSRHRDCPGRFGVPLALSTLAVVVNTGSTSDTHHGYGQ
jgi:hypothetical protein